MTKHVSVLCLVLALNACAQGTEVDQKTIQRTCRLDLEAARTAMQLRNQGKSKAEMLQTLPPLTQSSNRLVQQLYHIVDEVYTYPTLNQVVYPTYRFEYCTRQLQHLPVPAQFRQIAPQLLDCQTKFGTTVSTQAVDCVRDAMTAVAQAAPTTHTNATPNSAPAIP